jgi:hypothetical protein
VLAERGRIQTASTGKVDVALNAALRGEAVRVQSSAPSAGAPTAPADLGSAAAGDKAA